MKSVPVFYIIFFFFSSYFFVAEKRNDSLLFALNVLLTVIKSILDEKNRRLINALCDMNQPKK